MNPAQHALGHGAWSPPLTCGSIVLVLSIDGGGVHRIIPGTIVEEKLQEL
jgi:hypothetical protein